MKRQSNTSKKGQRIQWSSEHVLGIAEQTYRTRPANVGLGHPRRANQRSCILSDVRFAVNKNTGTVPEAARQRFLSAAGSMPLFGL